MANIKVKDLSVTNSVNTDDKIMALTDEPINQVQNITVNNFLTSVISSDVDNAIVQGADNKLFVEDLTSNIGDLNNLTTADKTSLVNAINELDGDVGNLSNLTTTNKSSIVNAINELDGDIGDLANLTTADKSSIVNAINDAVNSTLNGANTDLSNLTSNGEARLHALKAYADEGELLTDTEGLADVKSYAHSTFDLSKFTVVGSPNITSDGNASGFSGSNYLKLDTSSINFTKKWKIEAWFQLNSSGTAAGSWIYSIGTDYSINGRFGIALLKENTNKFLLAHTIDGTSWQSNAQIQFDTIPTAGHTYHIIDEYDGTKYYGQLDVYDVNGNKTSTENKETVAIQGIEVSLPCGMIGCRVDSTAPFAIGSIDLKQFSITVDGVEVFNGNRTGIDTIKPDDYTVVGTPTISADGIASGFSTSSYIKTSTLNLDSNNWVLECDFIVTDSTESPILTGSDTGETKLAISWLSDTNIRLAMGSNGSSWDIANNLSIPANVPSNTKNSIKLLFNGTQYLLYVNGILVKTIDSTSKIYTASTTVFDLGVHRNKTSAFTGSIDLNSFKIYVDGNLVYQPCLKIPYTESKTGSKIVDSIYRDRVNDMAEQFGYANYYTLQDEAKGNYTVVGSPTISSDFIASGFSSSNSIVFKNSTIKTTDSFNIKCKFKVGESANAQKFFDSIEGFRAEVNPSRTNIHVRSTANDDILLDFGRTVSTSEEIYFELEANSSSYIYKVWIGNEYIGEKTGNIALIQTDVSSLSIGGDQYYLAGSIDLKEFKIYVNGKLTYQAVEPPNFTLPQVELYGLIENRLDVNMATQSEKNTIIGWGMPDYSKAISFNPSSGDALGFNGWLQCEINSGYADTVCTASINGVVICKTSSGSSGGIPDASTSVVMVKSTDVITMSHPEITTLKKIPFTGGNL